MRSILELLIAGKEAQIQASQEAEAGKLGRLRGGNTGMVDGTGRVIGSCARLAHLRSLGITSDPVTIQKALMFDGGLKNEDIWKETILAANEPGLVLRCEEEIPIQWTTKEGRLVTGRPDIVLGRMVPPAEGDAEPLFVAERGIELKQVFSLWTARDVLFKGKPKMSNLLQSGHYAYQLGIPYELWYTNRSTFAITDYSDTRFFAKKNFPKEGAPLSEYCRYNERNQILSIEPFVVGYELQWNDKQQLMYRQIAAPGAAENKWVYTIITWDSIAKYYSLAANAATILPPRPHNVLADGEAGGYDLCDYCPLSEVCTAHEKKGSGPWTVAVQTHLGLDTRTNS